jgi:integration host factor subunit beta
MNKSDLIDALSTKENLTEKNASEIINLVFGGFTDTLKKGGRIELRGFGSFTVRKYGGYTGRNPKTGDKIDVKPKRSPFFKVGKKLREKVNHRSIAKPAPKKEVKKTSTSAKPKKKK